MLNRNRHTVFVEDNASGTSGESVANRIADEAVPHKGPKPTPSYPTHRRYAAKRTYQSERLAPILIGSPWQDYEETYALKFWCMMRASTAKSDHKRALIRTVDRERITDEEVNKIRRLFHQNVVQTLEIYTSTTEVSIVCEFMLTSLHHLCRSPKYPSEQQLSSIAYQVLSGIEYLFNQDLIHEKISCNSILLSYHGQVKIGDVECCTYQGDLQRFSKSFGLIMMSLMDKNKTRGCTVGLTQPDRWTDAA